MRARSIAVLLLCASAPVFALSGKDHHRPEPQPVQDYALPQLGMRGAPTIFTMLEGRVAATLHFVDDQHVLLSFGVRKLLPRDQAEGDNHEDRTIQLEIVDLQNGKIEQSRTLVAHDGNAYLWPLGGGEFLLRIGDQFSRLDKQLEIHDLARTNGPVTWVQSNPAANLAVVIVQHEKHTPEEHQKLHHDALLNGTPDPSEREEAFGFAIRPQFKPLFRADVASAAYVAASGDWNLQIEQEGVKGKYDVQLRPWQEPGSPAPAASVVARVNSSCTPNAAALSTTSLLLEVCDGDNVRGYGEALSPTVEASPSDAAKPAPAPAPTGWTGRQLWTTGLSALPRTTLNAATAGKFLLEQTVVPWRAEDQNAQAKGALRIIRADSGTEALTLTLKPLYGLNQIADISPDGTRVAVLRDEALQVFVLPPAPAAPAGKQKPEKAKAGAQAPAGRS